MTEAYCVKCKKKVTMANEQAVKLKNGRPKKGKLSKLRNKGLQDRQVNCFMLKGKGGSISLLH